MTLIDLIKRDWPGMIATAITFGLFGVGVYLTIDARHTLNAQHVRTEMILLEVARNRSEILSNREQLNTLQDRLSELRDLGTRK